MELKNMTIKEKGATGQPKRSRFAFTLAEVLITLGLIGIVAAMTIPTLTQRYREKVLINRLKDTYSIFSQAYKLAVNEYDSPEGWDIGEKASHDGAVKVYNYFKPFLKLGQDCGEEYGCFASSYSTFSGVEYGFAPYGHPLYARGVLMNGVAFAFASAGSGCSVYDEPQYGDYCAMLYIDVNGYDLPNKTGIDYFGFIITPTGVVPLGRPDDKGLGNGYTCTYKGKNSGNGTGCTAYVLKKGNMDYLRRDISNDWK